MTTRERILQASLALFNAEGVANVPFNRIATELGMSQGNLHYHFKRKEEIVDWLWRRFERESEPILAGPAAPLASTDDLWLFLHLGFEKIHDYRFIYRDIDSLFATFPLLGTRLRALTAQSVATLRRLCEELVAAGCMNANDDDIEVLAMQMMLTATCWFSFARVLPESEDTGPGRAAYQVLSLLAPYLANDERVYIEYLRRKYID